MCLEEQQGGPEEVTHGRRCWKAEPEGQAQAGQSGTSEAARKGSGRKTPRV